MLGPIHLRTDEAPTKAEDGSLKGGVLFERSEFRAVPARPGIRCYQYQGLSTETARNVSSVNANSKTPVDEDRKLKNRIMKVIHLSKYRTWNILLIKSCKYRIIFWLQWLQSDWHQTPFTKRHVYGPNSSMHPESHTTIMFTLPKSRQMFPSVTLAIQQTIWNS